MTVKWEAGWELISRGITKLKRIIEGLPENKFTAEEIMTLYTTVYNMCTQKRPHDYRQQLYDSHRETLEEYIHSKVLPSILEKHEDAMLQELVRRWENHKAMILWMSRFFGYLDRYFIRDMYNPLPCLKDVGVSCFRDLVYKKVEVDVRAAVIALSNKLFHDEREGEQAQRALLEHVRNVILEILQVDGTLALAEKFQNLVIQN